MRVDFILSYRVAICQGKRRYRSRRWLQALLGLAGLAILAPGSRAVPEPLGTETSPFVSGLASSQSFLELPQDGSWVGAIRLDTADGRRRFPLHLNLNAEQDRGIGFALFPDDLDGAPSAFEVLALRNLRIRGRRIEFDLFADLPARDGSEESASTTRIAVHSFVLRYSSSGDTLRGDFTSNDSTIPDGRVSLWRSTGAAPHQGTWTGTASPGGAPTRIVLQLIVQGSAIQQRQELPGGRFRELNRTTAAPSAAAPITGFGFVDEAFGRLARGATVTGNVLSGVLLLPDGQLTVELTRTGQSLRGTLQRDNIKTRVDLVAVGTSGRPIKAAKARPVNLLAGASTPVTVHGRNFSAGTMVHLALVGDRSATRRSRGTMARVSFMEVRSPRELGVRVVPSAQLQQGSQLSLRVVGPDGQFVDLVGALRIEQAGKPATVSFANDLQPVFTSRCALSGCHVGPVPVQNLELSRGIAYDQIVHVPSIERADLLRVDPGNPDDSYLIRKIRGIGIVGSRMPLIGEPLSPNTIALFETWVREQAREG